MSQSTHSAPHRFPSAAAVALAMVMAAGCGSQSAPPPEQAPAAPTVSITSAGPKIYVSDETGGEVVVVDAAQGSVLGRIPVGKRPRGMKISHDGKTLYVALSGSPIAGPGVDEDTLPPGDRSADGIGVIDLATGKVTRVLPSGQDPEAFDISADDKTLYISNEETAEMAVLDIATGSIRAHVKVGEEPEGVTVRPDGKVVYVTCEETNEVVAVDTATLKIVARMKASGRPRSVVFTADSKTGFVANETGGSVSVINTAKHTVVKTITLPKGGAVPPRPMTAILSADAKHVLVSLGRAQGVAEIDAETFAITRTLEGVGARVWGITLSADGTKLYTANGPSNDISIVDIATGQVDKKIPTGGSPWGVVATILQ